MARPEVLLSGAVQPARLVAICRPRAPICPRCGQMLVGSPVTVDRGSILRCRNLVRVLGFAKPQECSQHVVICPAPGSLAIVFAISPQESRQLEHGEPLTLPAAEVATLHDARGAAE